MRAFFSKRVLIITIAGALWGCGHTLPSGPSPGPAVPSDPFSALILLYQGPLNHLSAVRRGECPMHPSCSQYARQAIEAFGPSRGWVMAHDRLLRCGRDEVATAPKVLVEGKWKFFDPVSANDFWRAALE